MKPEAADALRRARESLLKARVMLTNDFPDEAGRLSYGAGLNAARALIFERTGRVVKTHTGSHSEFARLTRDDPAFTDKQRRFLGQTYMLKIAADYGPAPGADPETAREAIALAADLVAAIEAAIAASPEQKDPP